MSRYTGPRVRVMRALGVDLPGLSPKTSDRRPFRPGQHGNQRHKITEYGKRLIEKQKLRFNYGLRERQLQNLMKEASASRQNTSTKLAELVERRLDNAVFRSRFAVSIPAARQLVNHGHILVNNKKVDIPSFRIKVGDVIAVRDRSKKHASVVAGTESRRLFETDWLDVNEGELKSTVKALPDEHSILFPIEMQLIIEFNSR